MLSPVQMPMLMMAVVMVVVVVGNVASMAPPAPSPPMNLPGVFSDTNLTLYGAFAGSEPIYYYNTEIFYDETYKGERIDFNIDLGDFNLPFVTIQTNATYLYDNGVCRKSSDTTFEPIWTWIPASKYGGSAVINGRNCSEFYLSYNEILLAVYVLTSSLTEQVQIPVLFTIQTSPTVGNTSLLFSTNFSTNPFDTSVFALSDTCFNFPVCPSGPTMNQSIYLFHEANDFTLNNTNVADELGDVAFVCLADSTDMFSYFSWVSQYTVSFNTTWGQYGLCNFGSCIGGADDRVGKEAPEGLESATGQCGNNTNYGNWYSLPPYNETLCPAYANGTIGIGGTAWFGCGWNIIEKVKTINGSCLVGNGFLKACITDNGYPYATASQVWANAFAYDDPSVGGCPPIDVTEVPATQARNPTTPSHPLQHNPLPHFTILSQINQYLRN